MYLKEKTKDAPENLVEDVDYYKYSKVGKIMMRSQIDCEGEDADGNRIVFEIKTRAIAVMRYEIEKYIDYLDYKVLKKRGIHSSYEREYYDLIRGGFLKYIL